MLVLGAFAPMRLRGAMEFGWWEKDEEGIKWNITVRFHGGNVTFSRKHGHNSSWEDFTPSDDQWDRLLKEAEKRLPRRLMSQKQFNQLKAERPQ
jgi:hypothetical protein